MRYIDEPQIYLNTKNVSKSLQIATKWLLLSNQKKILKRGMTYTIQKPKGTTFKVEPLSFSKYNIY